LNITFPSQVEGFSWKFEYFTFLLSGVTKTT
jgi:hypothetical protein